MARVLEVEPLFTVFAAAAAMLLVTTFPSDDAFARGDFCSVRVKPILGSHSRRSTGP
jgi:hypothetical protein